MPVPPPVDNPLIDFRTLPRFADIRPEHALPAMEWVIADTRERIEALLAADGGFDWDSVGAPLEALQHRLSRVWSLISHLNSVINSPELRDAYNACLPLLSAWLAELGQNQRLFSAYEAIRARDDFSRLSQSRRRIVENALRDFRLSGIALADADKTRFRDIVQELALLNSKFEQNLLDATNGWTRLVTVETGLAGLPESARASARQTAERNGLEGWQFTLEFPSWLAVMTHADDRELRREMYEAFVTRASDEGPCAGRWDNGPLMEKILALRHEQARLLGYANYAERSLETRMAGTTQQVLDFLYDLAERTLPVARGEFGELTAFARDHLGLDRVEAWDQFYASEKLRRHAFDLSQDELRAWFPHPRVIDGMFAIVQRLYGITIRPRDGVQAWHPDVRFYELFDAGGELRGQFYMDLYARPNKRGGAWMDECVIRRNTPEGLEIPVAYLVCNFTPPVGDDPALLTHDEVLTLFHEFGHGLHHLLTRIDDPGVAGIQGVPWDAVELPSQFMENWCWQRETLPMISAHYRTGEPLPADRFERLLAARNFQSGMKMVRQLEFALFDFRMHAEYDPGRGGRIYEILREVRERVAVMQPPSFNRFPHSFSHIFAGGYAAGYYGYKWAEVLSSDAFARFEEEGLFNVEVARRFLTTILEQGGSRDPMELFIEFRGREPQIDALLRHSGIAA